MTKFLHALISRPRNLLTVGHWSVRCTSDGEIVRPRALAVLGLMTR